MSKNIQQVYTDNPITTNQSTDLMYFGRSPYGTNDDCAMTFQNFAAQFGGGGSGYFNFTQLVTPGVSSFTPNIAATKMVVEIIGGGGGGWAKLETDATQAFVSSAGGAGGYLRFMATDFTPEYEFGVLIGEGGTAASDDNTTPPGTGNPTRFGSTDLTGYLEGSGGYPGQASGLITAATDTVLLPTGTIGGINLVGTPPYTFTLMQYYSPPVISMGWIAGSTDPMFNAPEVPTIIFYGVGGLQRGGGVNTNFQLASPGLSGAINIYEFG